MRQIEEQMLFALRSGRDWRNGNTSVSWTTKSPTFGGTQAVVRLHGNRIGIYQPSSGTLNISDGEGWRTHTTKSRLNALLTLIPGRRLLVFQWKGEWRFQRHDGTAEPWRGWRVIEYCPIACQWNA
jgi:hypothetical protein